MAFPPPYAVPLILVCFPIYRVLLDDADASTQAALSLAWSALVLKFAFWLSLRHPHASSIHFFLWPVQRRTTVFLLDHARPLDLLLFHR